MNSREVRRAVIGGATDVGAVRHENEDSFGIWGPEAGDWDFLVAVADGVGGHEHGKQASELALSALLSSLTAQPLPHNDEGLRRALHTALIDANVAVYSTFPGTGTSRPGSTLTCVLSRGGKCYVGHVGDSRAYMIRGGRAFQLSTDHTWVQFQVDKGTMTPEEAATSPYRNQVLQVLGTDPNVEPDVVVRPTAPGDVFIVCSDGVTEHVSVSQLLAESISATSAEGFAKALVSLAVAQGGSDNATAVVAGVPFRHSTEAKSATPETSEIPLLKQPQGAQSTAAAPSASPTVPLPSVPDQVCPRRDWRPLLAGGLVALFVLLGFVLISVRRNRTEPPTELEHGTTAANQEDQGARKPRDDARGPSVPLVPSMDGPVVRLVRSISLPRVEHVVFSHDGSRVAILSPDNDPGRAEQWLLDCFTVRDGTKLFGKSYYIEAGSQVIFSPDDKLIYHQFCTGSLDRGGPAAISATTGDPVWQARGREHFTGGLALSPTGGHLAVGDWCDEGAIRKGGAMYNANVGRVRKTLPELRQGYVQFVFSPKGSYMAARTGLDVRVLRTDDWTVKYVLRDLPHREKLANCDGKLAITGGEDAGRQLRLVDWISGATVEEHSLPGLCALSPNAKWYVSDDAANGCALHSYPDGRMLQQVGSAETHLQTISDDGKWLAVTQGDEVLIFDTLPEYQ